MSRKERERMTVMAGVRQQNLTLVQACELMAVGYRQSKRIWKRSPADEDAGLVHRLRGGPSARRKPALRSEALGRNDEAAKAFTAALAAHPAFLAERQQLEGWLKSGPETR